MKKIILVFATVITVLSLVSCMGNSNDTYPSDENNGMTASENEQNIPDTASSGNMQNIPDTASSGNMQSIPDTASSGNMQSIPDMASSVTEPDIASFIGEERAKEIALERAGVTADGAFFDRVELDRDRGEWLYEVEFTKDGIEYDAEIKADDGSILSWETDYGD